MFRRASLIAALVLCAGVAQANDLENLVVYIECDLPGGGTSTGSGVLVSPRGHILTARHVAPDGSKCEAREANKESPIKRNLFFAVEDKNLHPDIDGRLLRYAPSADDVFPYATYCTIASRKVLDPVLSIGFHSKTVGRPSVTAGILSSTTMDMNGFVETDAEAAGGKSGGPVFLGETPRIIGIIGGAQFDSLGVITNYAILAVDALVAAFPVLEEAPDCQPPPEPEIAEFKPGAAYFKDVLRNVRSTPENDLALMQETIKAHAGFFDGLTGFVASEGDVQELVSAAKAAMVSDPPDAEAVRVALQDASYAQSEADLLSGALSTLDFAKITRLQADLEAALLSRKEAARLYREAGTYYPPDQTALIWDSLYQAGVQLSRRTRDTNDNDALAQSIAVLKQARDQSTLNSMKSEWVDTQLELGNVYRRQGERECGIGNFELAEATYADALKEVDRDKDPLIWAEFANNQALAKFHRAGRTRSERALDEAILLFQDILPVLEFDPSPSSKTIWADTLDNLGKALRLRGMRSAGTDDLEDALEAFEKALTVRNRRLKPYDWSMTQHNIGRVYTELGRRESQGENLEKALNIFRDALEVRTRQALPARWAATQHNLARTTLYLGQRERNEVRVKEAIDILEGVLQVQKRDVAPIEWAQTHASLGLAYFTQGEASLDKEALLNAKTSYEQALDSRFTDNLSLRECNPHQWASAVNNLGNALLRLGQSGEGLHYFDEAAAQYASASEEWRRDTDPLAWARLQHNSGTAKLSMGQAKLSMGQQQGSVELIDAAAGDFRAALEVRSIAKTPSEWVETSTNLGAALYMLAGNAGDLEMLQEAADILDEAVEVSGNNKVGRSTANYYAGLVYMTFYGVNNDEASRQAAMKNLKEAEDYYLEANDQTRADGIRELIDQLL